MEEMITAKSLNLSERNRRNVAFKFHFPLFLLLCLARPVDAETVVFQTDFQNPPAEVKVGKGCSASDGKLTLNGIKGGVVSTGMEVSVDGEFAVSFKLRAVERKSDVKDGHIGIDLFMQDEGWLKLFSRGDRWSMLYTPHGRKGRGECSLLKRSSLAADIDVPVEIQFRKDAWTFTAGKEILRLDYPSFSPLKRLSFYSYNWLAEIRDVQITALGPEKVQPQTAPTLLFSEDFDTDASLKNAKGAGLTDGISGTALQVAEGSPPFKLTLPEPIGKNGTISFWFRRTQEKRTGTMLKSRDTGGKRQLLGVDVDPVGLNTMLGCTEGIAPRQARRWNNAAINRDEWHFYAITFQEDGFVRIMFDALSYYDYGSGYWAPQQFSQLALNEISSLDLYPGWSYDCVQVRNHAMTEAELNQEFRGHVPVDLRMDDTILTAGEERSLVFRVAPGGVLMTPPPYETSPSNARLLITAKLVSTDGTELAKQDYDLDVNRIIECRLPPLTLKHKEQARADFYIGSIKFMSFMLTGWKPGAAPRVSDADFRKGKLLFEKTFDSENDPSLILRGPVRVNGNYLEMGKDKYNCVAIKVPFEEEYCNGQPVLLEIDWPDDKPRNMGLYMYKPSKGKQLRDCLESGIAAGNEFPNSGGICTVKHLFYPSNSSYLFEARTMSAGCPAAISAFRVYAIDGGLPRLAIHYPEGMAHRKFGHLDEDQTFDYVLDHAFSYRSDRPTKYEETTETLLNYLDYTGQELFAYPLLRYTWGYYPLMGTDLTGLYPYRPDYVPFMFRALAERGKTVRVIINLHGLPEFKRQAWREKEWAADGRLRMNAFGEPLMRSASSSANMLSPDVENLFLAHIEQVLRQNAHAENFGAMDYWVPGMIGAVPAGDAYPAEYADHFAEKGVCSYDDCSVNLYRKGADPDMPDFTGSDRFMKRFKYLLEPDREARWESWNHKKVVEHIVRVRELIDRYNPGIELAVCYEHASKPYANFSLLDHPRISVNPQRNPMHFRWSLQHADKITEWNEKSYGPVSEGMPLPMVSSFYNYNETFADSPSPEYASYFQDIDMKPSGRFFLKDMVYALAKYDMLEWTHGGQLLVSLGREEETREFARAFCALPAQHFETVPGSGDPVTVRCLNTANGCYVYCASLIFKDCEVSLDGVDELADLSDSSTVSANTVKMKPFQLRSFIVKGRGPVKINSAAVKVPGSLITFYENEFTAAQARIDTARGFGIDVSEAETMLAQARTAFAGKKYAEAHTLLFSAAWHRIRQMVADPENMTRIKGMLAKNTLRVNCGSKEFYQAPDGRLFVPDAEYSDGLGYGFTSRSWNFCSRSVEGLKEDANTELFKTEVYRIESYKANLANGSYRVRLYMRFAYGPTFKKPESQIATRVRAGDETWNLDFKEEMKKDMANTVIHEFRNVPVTDGIFEILFPDGGDFSLLNGVEIEPETAKNEDQGK